MTGSWESLTLNLKEDKEALCCQTAPLQLGLRTGQRKKDISEQVGGTIKGLSLHFTGSHTRSIIFPTLQMRKQRPREIKCLP
jgi:hypothetical protein